MLPTRNAARVGARLFISAKTTSAIPTRCTLLWDALVQASLDPAVRSIEYVASGRVESTSIDLSAVVLCRDDGRHLLDVVPARTLRDVEDEGLALIALGELALPTVVLTAADIQREPRFSNCRMVWTYRMHAVGIGMRLRILQALAEDGPLPLSQLLAAIQGDRDPAPAVMAMACSNLVELDLTSGALGPSTLARSLA